MPPQTAVEEKGPMELPSSEIAVNAKVSEPKLYDSLSEDETRSISTEEKRILRKIDFRVMPLAALWEIGTRYNGGFVLPRAKLGGIMTDLNLTEDQFRWCLTGPFLAFFFLSIPINIILRKGRASVLMAAIAIIWGGLTMCTAATRNFAGLIICQIIIGVSASANNPVQSYYISLWYKRRESAQRLGIFTIAGSIATGTLGLISYAISQIRTERLNTWQWMFIIFGIPGILVGILASFFLPDSPPTAKFLTEKERAIVVNRLASEQAKGNLESWSWAQASSILKDWKVYCYGAVFALGSIIGSGVRLNLPAIVDGMGDWSDDVSLALTTPPWIITCIVVFFIARWSDKIEQRSLFLISIYSVSAIGFFIIIFTPEIHVGPRYFGVCLLTIGTMADSPIRISWCINNFSGLTRRAVATAIVFSIDAAGNAIGGQAYFDPPQYRMGHVIALCAYAANVVLILTLRFIFKSINKKRDSMTPEQKEKQIVKFGGLNLAGDRHPDYRYVL
ncbi:major facilitator superfamily domain-containing protein [Fennellomyces sp. T-0311]|nr:major facilitator superfamily domain-containing protein [Fennellomyces sp. T-0311]